MIIILIRIVKRIIYMVGNMNRKNIHLALTDNL